MIRRYEVTLFTPARYSADYVPTLRRSFRTQASAHRFADRLASRHSLTSLRSASRYPLVQVFDKRTDTAETLSPSYVPSVGERGYW